MDKLTERLLNNLEPTYAGQQSNVAQYFIELFPWDENDLKNPKLIDHINKVKEFMDRLLVTGLVDLHKVYKELGTVKEGEYLWLTKRPINGQITKKGYDLLKESRERLKDKRRFCTTLTISIVSAIIAFTSMFTSIATYKWNTTKKSEQQNTQLELLRQQVQTTATQLQELSKHLQADSSVKKIIVVK